MAKVLIVDDRAEDRELLFTLLNYAGHSVIEAENGAEALDAVRTEHPHLVISDILLPSVDGYEFVRQLRNDPSIAQTKVIFYTALFNEQESRNLAKDLGVSRILTKPTEPQRILELVAEELGPCELNPTRTQNQQFKDRHRELLINKLLEKVEELSESEQRFRMMAENASDLVFRYRIGPAPGFEYINPAVTEMLGYEPQSFYSDPEFLLRIIHPDQRSEVFEFFRGKSLQAPHCRFLHKNGQIVWIEIRSTHIRDASGNITAIDGIARNITQRIVMIEELCSSRDELEERVAERTAELASANQKLLAKSERLEVLNQGLQEFAFIASHDLQEPLRKITTFGNMLKSKFAGSINVQGRDYIERMVSSADRMKALLHALLEYSRVSTRSVSQKAASLTEIATEAVCDLEIAIEKAGAMVEIGELPDANVDPVQMRQLFQNLISNSIKYFNYGKTADGPHVKIYGQVEKGGCRIFIEDNGIGFDENYLDRIFRPFQRLHGKNEYDGTGMGLATCSKIVERHGGAITAKSKPGLGSTFIITLPSVLCATG